jgi:hypothetical protein
MILKATATRRRTITTAAVCSVAANEKGTGVLRIPARDRFAPDSRHKHPMRPLYLSIETSERIWEPYRQD